MISYSVRKPYVPDISLIFIECPLSSAGYSFGLTTQNYYLKCADAQAIMPLPTSHINCIFSKCFRGLRILL
jgi:hypothetical protein